MSITLVVFGFVLYVSNGHILVSYVHYYQLPVDSINDLVHRVLLQPSKKNYYITKKIMLFNLQEFGLKEKSKYYLV